MSINRLAIKSNAKYLIFNSKPNPIIVALIYSAIIYILNYFINTISGHYQITMKTMEQMLAGNYSYVPVMPEFNPYRSILTASLIIMLIMMRTGFIIYCMNVGRLRQGSYWNLLDGFSIFFKAILLHILILILVYLWSILFIIPGIIAFYRYRMALFVMIDNPHLSVFECLKASKKMMNGRKRELFILDLSFLGWGLLSIVPFVIIWVKPYTTITYVNYYLALRDMPYSEYNKLV